ncbi:MULTISPECIES: type II secretion system F family protein [Vibrio]|uniref:type II secretion system F family protein n=1 Tax=Vibrio TaxID=662 RepID=UPI0002DF9B20|nr:MULTISPECIES: type II secretion system F family protein [Vibrio]MCC4888715.1 type II secretion system F family protein [Vibrio sp. F13]OEF08603.1 biotin synthase [Vibrio crassostreae 9ZC77]TKF99809.1 type II secretion system F family protein [Vibrio sp. F13]UPR30552.1 type II secretion system F family protein [Vibrio crassostreae]
MQTQTLIFVFLVLLFACLSYLFFKVYTEIGRRRMLNKFSLFDEPKAEVRKGEGLDNLFDNLSSTLTSSKDDIDKKLDDAGIYNSNISQYYMLTKYVVAFLGCVIIYILLSRFEFILNQIIAMLAIWFVLCVIAPDSYLAVRQKALRRKISNQLPYLLDLMAICIQTGMTLESAMSYLSHEMEGFDKDLSYQLNKINERTKIVTLDIALDEFYNRIPTPEVRSFIMTLKQSLKYGSSIFDVLTTLASDIREVNMLGVEEKIGKLAAKMSIPLILFIMMPIVILITAPGIMRVMANV